MGYCSVLISAAALDLSLLDRVACGGRFLFPNSGSYDLDQGFPNWGTFALLRGYIVV